MNPICLLCSSGMDLVSRCDSWRITSLRSLALTVWMSNLNWGLSAKLPFTPVPIALFMTLQTQASSKYWRKSSNGILNLEKRSWSKPQRYTKGSLTRTLRHSGQPVRDSWSPQWRPYSTLEIWKEIIVNCNCNWLLEMCYLSENRPVHSTWPQGFRRRIRKAWFLFKLPTFLIFFNRTFWTAVTL